MDGKKRVQVGDEVSWQMPEGVYKGTVKSIRPDCCDDECKGRLCRVRLSDFSGKAEFEKLPIARLIKQRDFEVCDTAFQS